MEPNAIPTIDSKVPISRRHHYTPRFLLNNFAIDGAIWAADKETGRQWQTSPAKTGFEMDYNTVPSSKFRRDAGELLLAELDARAAPVIADILKFGSLPHGDDAQTEALLGFVATQFFRAPAARGDGDQALNELCYRILDLSSSSKTRWKDLSDRARADGVPAVPAHEEIRDIVTNESFRFSGNTAWHLTRSAQLAEALVPFLAQRNWYLGKSDSESLICGDTTVTIINTRRESGYWSSPGFGLSHTEVAMPLSRHWVLLGRFEPVSYDVVSLNRRRVAELNSRALWHSTRFVWSATKHFPLVDEHGEIHEGIPEPIDRRRS